MRRWPSFGLPNLKGNSVIEAMFRSLLRRFLCLVWGLSVLSSMQAATEAPVSIEGVSFALVRPMGGDQPWYEIAIEIEGQTRDAAVRAVPLEVVLEVAFRSVSGGGFSFYQSAVGLIVPESGDDATIYFYLPPGIVERDDLRGDPFGWRVQLTQAGEPFPQRPGSFSSSLSSAEAAQSFAQRITTEAMANDGWLQPIYLTPFYHSENGRLEGGPSYRRREPSHRE